MPRPKLPLGQRKTGLSIRLDVQDRKHVALLRALFGSRSNGAAIRKGIAWAALNAKRWKKPAPKGA
jgi:hypothetical protein